MGASCSMALLSQVSTSYPRVPRDSFARTQACFLIIQLSEYGQFMLSTSFLPLHGCWSLHYDLCPSHFHTHSDRLFRIISALSLSFHIYSIFYWKERNSLPLPFSFPATPVYSLTFPWTVHIHYPVRFFRSAGTDPLISYRYFPPQLHHNCLRSSGWVCADDFWKKPASSVSIFSENTAIPCIA